MSELWDGDIVLVSARKWTRPLMQYDHAGIIWRYRDDLYCVEAGASGVRSWPMAHWGRGYTVIRPIVACAKGDDRDRRLGEAVAATALRMQGWPYSWRHLARVVWRILGARIRAQEAVVCSELTCGAWRLNGVELCPGVLVPSPDDIWKAVAARRATVVLTGE